MALQSLQPGVKGLSLPRFGTRWIETPAEFHARMIARCELLADQYDHAAAMATAPRTRETKGAKAAAERANAEAHRQRLADLEIKAKA